MSSPMAWYDAAEWYDLAFSWDPKGEIAFLGWAFENHARGPVRTVLEPGCGSGHFLIPLRRDHRVIGFDINPSMIRLVNEKAARAGVGSPPVYRGDFSRFELARPVDSAYMLIDTIRHLTTRRALRRHFRCMREAIRPGGVYVLGLDLADPDANGPVAGQSWTMERGERRVTCSVGTRRGPDRHRQQEFHESVLECTDGERSFTITSRYRMSRILWKHLVEIARIG
ncbi:MAG: class I SAM-dependent methyltransferase, partial [Planctomycetota bacterium]